MLGVPVSSFDSDSPGQEMLDLIHMSSDQMLDMVGKLLDSEALESGELNLHLEPISLSKIAEEVARRNRPQAQRKNETFILHLDESDPILEGAPRDEHGHIRLAEIPLGDVLRKAVRESLASRGVTVAIGEGRTQSQWLAAASSDTTGDGRAQRNLPGAALATTPAGTALFPPAHGW